MKARAVLCGRGACEPEDVRVVRFLTAFRVPEAVHNQIEAIIESAIAEEAAEEQVSAAGVMGVADVTEV